MLPLAMAGATLLARPSPAVAARAPCSAAPTMTANHLITQLAAHHTFECHGITIQGTVRLGTLKAIDVPLRCLDCTFTGSVLGRYVDFEQIVDLSGSRIEGDLDLHGANFKDEFLMVATTEHRSDVEGQVNFTLATFTDRALFDRAWFEGPQSLFQGTRFKDDASFADVYFLRGVSFLLASFEGEARFNALPNPGSSAPAEASRRCPADGGAAFGPADFAQVRFARGLSLRFRCFADYATFFGTSFGGRVDATATHFSQFAVFSLTVFNAPASFDSAKFDATAYFDDVTGTGSLILDGARLQGQLDMKNVNLDGGLSMDNTRCLEGINHFVVAVSSLDISLPQIQTFRNDKTRDRALKLVVATAKGDGDLGLANQAEYRHLALESKGNGGLRWIVDPLLYRGVLGYFVLFWHPLAALGALLCLSILIRYLGLWGEAHREKGRPAPPPTEGQPSEAANPTGGGQAETDTEGKPSPEPKRVLRPVIDSFSAVTALKPNFKTNCSNWYCYLGIWTMRLVEYVALKVVIFAVIAAIGSTNSTLRDLIEAIKP